VAFSSISGLKRRIEKLEREHVPAVATRPIWTPWPHSPQVLAMESEADELLFGGAAGGGKSDLLIGLALTRHRRTIIFRREFTQLAGIIERVLDLISPVSSAWYHHTDHVVKGLPGDRKLEFGSMPREEDKKKFQGRPHDLVGWDELTGFTESQYIYTGAWNRTTIPGQRYRRVSTTNPPTKPEEEWVIVRWAPWLDDQHDYPAKAAELRWYATIDGKDTELENHLPFEWKGELVKPRSRTFVPARVADNPALFSSGYADSLAALPEPLRTQLLKGDFSVKPVSDPYQVIPTAWIHAAVERWRAQGGHQTRLTALGVDVARGGSDRTVLTPVYSNYFGVQRVYAGSETPDGDIVAKHVVSALGLNPEHVDHGVIFGNRTPLGIDIIGVGASVYDTLHRNRFNAMDIDFRRGAGTTDRSGKLHFANVRAAAYWAFREALDPDYGEGLCLPPTRELLVDLTAAHWSVGPRGIILEPKDKIADRIGRSPDWGDSAILGWWAHKYGRALPTSTGSIAMENWA
jgi:hypothetical protein